MRGEGKISQPRFRKCCNCKLYDCMLRAINEDEPIYCIGLYTPITNRDRLAWKSNEELAEWIDTVQDDAIAYGMCDAESNYPIGTRNWLAWLEQEAEI